MKRVFSLGTVLSVTTGRLLSPAKRGDNGIRHCYELLGHMTGEAPCTHQLSRFAEECKPWLFRWFPELRKASVCLDELDTWIKCAANCPEEGVKMWLTELRIMFPDIKENYAIGQIPRDDHTAKNPYDEFVAERGTDENIIIVELPESKDP